MSSKTLSDMRKEARLDRREAKAVLGGNAVASFTAGIATGIFAADAYSNSPRTDAMAGTHQPAVPSMQTYTGGGAIGGISPNPTHPEYVFVDATPLSSVRTFLWITTLVPTLH